MARTGRSYVMSTFSEGRWRPGFNAQFWLVASTIGGGGLLAGFVFYFVGRLARRPDWWIPGPIYLVGSLTFLTLMVRGPAADRNSFGNAFVAVWLSSLAYAVIIVVLLRWSTRYREWCSPPRAPLAPPPGGHHDPDAAASAAWGSAPPAPIDVNSAEARQLAALPGFGPDRVRRVLAERRTRRGFGTVEEFAAAADLAPHEFVRIRDQVVCAPLRSDPRQPPTHGRILDV
jgi:hypothetical protein